MEEETEKYLWRDSESQDGSERSPKKDMLVKYRKKTREEEKKQVRDKQWDLEETVYLKKEKMKAEALTNQLAVVFITDSTSTSSELLETPE